MDIDVDKATLLLNKQKGFIHSMIEVHWHPEKKEDKQM
jgi:hypothetical protein